MTDDLKKLIKIICDHGEEICESSRMAKLVRPYMELSEEYSRRGVTPYFSDVYAAYYRMNGPSGSSPEFKKTYFSYLERLRAGEDISYEEIAKGLYETEKKHQFSLITKMLATAKDDSPVYDAGVAQVLGVGVIGQGPFSEKLKRGEMLIEEMKRVLGELSKDEDFLSVVRIFDEVYYKNKFPFFAKCHFIFTVYVDGKKKKKSVAVFSEDTAEEEEGDK
ncbi:MAG: hypothetical protein LUD29_01830 [Clostridia bacterium]|nr:hypothetical protein [Clostridia bacterium]